MRTVTFKMTSIACPEQYDAIFEGDVVGYLRLRHGHFTVERGGPGGELVYTSTPRGDGGFFTEERDRHLLAAAEALGYDYYELEDWDDDYE